MMGGQVACASSVFELARKLEGARIKVAAVGGLLLEAAVDASPYRFRKGDAPSPGNGSQCTGLGLGELNLRANHGTSVVPS